MVGTESEKARLDVFLAGKLGNLSRTALQKMIKQGKVSVNGKKVSVHHFLRAGDKVLVSEVEDKKQVTRNKLSKEKLPEISIVYEDDDVAVFEKPSGLLVHPAPGESGPTLVDFLVAKYPEIKKVGEDSKRPGIVHRLDRDTSGLLIVAKNQKSFESLKKQFTEREIIKEYLALVAGSINDDSGLIKFKIARSTGRARMAARPESQEGKMAVTEYEVMRRYANATLVKAKIKTGRTHQIRAHFHALGHPVVGDQVYKIRNVKLRLPLSRPFLHAIKLGYTDLSGKYREFTSPLPDELEDYLKKLKAL